MVDLVMVSFEVVVVVVMLKSGNLVMVVLVKEVVF